MARKLDDKQREKASKIFKPVDLNGHPVPGRTYAITGPAIVGTYKIKRLRAKTDGGGVVFLVEKGGMTEYPTRGHNFREIGG